MLGVYVDRSKAAEMQLSQFAAFQPPPQPQAAQLQVGTSPTLKAEPSHLAVPLPSGTKPPVAKL
eukprot:1079901-Prorocentrum_lima.AAC.1